MAEQDAITAIDANSRFKQSAARSAGFKMIPPHSPFLTECG
jgi:hypothetical protein